MGKLRIQSVKNKNNAGKETIGKLPSIFNNNLFLKYIQIIKMLFANNFYQNPLSSHAIELAIKYLFPWTEIQLTCC